MAMHAIRIHQFGGLDVLKDDTLPLPQPREDEILVKVCAASVNPVDGKIREGKFASVKEGDLPLTLGRDLSGIVEIVGTGIKRLGKGDAIFAFLGTDRGGYAQYAVVKPAEFAAKPDNISHVEAASVPLAALTAWQGLIDHGGLQAGQRILIHGGAGGVGHFAVQIANAKGAWVAATCAGRDLDFVRALGADQAIDYKNQKFEEEVSNIDLVYDLVAGETQERSFAVLKNGGALISTLKEPDKDKAKAKNLRVAHYMTRPNADQLGEIGELLRQGRIKPTIFATYELRDAARAQEALARDHVRGKIVLTVEV